MVERTATSVLVALRFSNLVQQAAFAASERTTALVTIAEANAYCVVETKQFQTVPAKNIANRFLDSKEVGDADS